jgi:hypothetical protein
MDLFVYIGACIVSAFFCSWYAKRKDESMGEWFVLGLIYPPFISIPAVMFCSRTLKK